MKQLFLIFLIFHSTFVLAGDGKPATIRQNVSGFFYTDTLTAKKPQPDTTIRFSYAEMYYLRQPKNYDKIIMWVAGDDVSEKLKKLVSEAKYKTWALTYMGDDGWELVSTVYYVSPVTSDYEFYYYFKKRRK